MVRCNTQKGELTNMIRRLFDFVFCCLPKEQQEMVYTAAESHNTRVVYDAQQNLAREYPIRAPLISDAGISGKLTL